MKLKTLIACFSISISITSCIQDEAPNAEADILSCTLSDPSVLRTNPMITNKSVLMMAYYGTDIKHISPYFTLTSGATIDPPSGTERDFSNAQTYIVTSQDGQWKKEYQIYVDTTNVKPKFSFELSRIRKGDNGKDCYEWYELTSLGQEQPIWATANGVFAMIASPDPNSHPTVVYDQGYIGRGVKLETKTTGALGDMVNMPIAAGNLFIGTFDSPNALKQPLQSTQFGIPMAYNRKPIAFSVWYQYKPGEVFTDRKKNVIEGKIDKFDAYAIIYESENSKKLDGSIQFDEDCIIAIARTDDPQPSDTYKQLYIPFEYRKPIDHEKMAKGEYYTTIVFSSSRAGAYFEGALGSTLIIDEAQLVLEGDQ